MKIKVSSNFGTKVLSVAIALILWFIVGNINDPVITRSFGDIPVQVVNEDVLESINKVYEITEGDTVSIIVRGKSSTVKNLRATDFVAKADLSKLSIVNAVPIEASIARNSVHSNRSGQIEISLGRVNTLKVKIEDRAEKMLPVIVETEGAVAKGFAIGSKTSSPNMVQVSGSESMIKRLKEIRIKVDVAGANKDISTRQTVKFYDQNGDPVEASTIKCGTAAVDVLIELWRTKEIPLFMETTGTVKKGYGIVTFDYEPKTVLIAASKDKLREITELTVSPLDVDGQSESLEKTITLDSSVLPEGVIFPGNTIDIVAKAVIEKRIAKEITLASADIEVRGLKNGQDAEFEKNSYIINVDSFASKLADINGASFEPYINVDEIDEETGMAPVHLTNPNGVIVTNAMKAKVTIR